MCGCSKPVAICWRHHQQHLPRWIRPPSPFIWKWHRKKSHKEELVHFLTFVEELDQTVIFTVQGLQTFIKMCITLSPSPWKWDFFKRILKLFFFIYLEQHFKNGHFLKVHNFHLLSFPTFFSNLIYQSRRTWDNEMEEKRGRRMVPLAVMVNGIE